MKTAENEFRQGQSPATTIALARLAFDIFEFTALRRVPLLDVS
jgi:hypothetical protein